MLENRVSDVRMYHDNGVALVLSSRVTLRSPSMGSAGGSWWRSGGLAFKEQRCSLPGRSASWQRARPSAL